MEVSTSTFHPRLFVSSDLPRSRLDVGGTAGAPQPALPPRRGPACGAEDRRRTGRPRPRLRLTVPPESGRTASPAPASFLRSGRFSALKEKHKQKMTRVPRTYAHNFHNWFFYGIFRILILHQTTIEGLRILYWASWSNVGEKKRTEAQRRRSVKGLRVTQPFNKALGWTTTE